MKEALSAASLSLLACVLGALAAQALQGASLVDRIGRQASEQPTTGGDAARAERWRRLIPPARAVAGLLLGGFVAGVPGGIAGLLSALVGPAVMRKRRAARLQEQTEAQLAEAVSTVASGLRAGLSLTQSIGFAAGEASPPLGPDLRQMVDRAAMGIALDESLERWVESQPAPDVRLVAGVLRLHNRMGGDLPTVLDQLARTLRERRAAAREVHSLTAQARLSGAILGLLPVGFFLFLSATSREDIAAAYHSPAGSAAIALGLALEAGAFLWIRRLLRVDL